MSDENQAAYAHQLAAALNEGVLQEAVSSLDDDESFEISVLDLLDSLATIGPKLVADDDGDVAIAYVSLAGFDRDLANGDSEPDSD